MLSSFWSRHPIKNLTRNRVVLPREGLTYLAIMALLLIGSMLGQSNMMLLVFAMMAGPFMVNGWTAFTSLQAARVGRQVPARAMAGQPFSVEVSYQNQRGLISAWMMNVRDQINGPMEQIDANVLFTRVGPHSTQIAHYRVLLGRRGCYEFGPMRASSRYPLGLIERGRRFPVIDHVLVYPRIGRLQPYWKRQLLGASELVTNARTRPGAYSDDFHHLREYRIGDNPRAIHWRSSARRNELILREYHQTREHHLSVVIDFHIPTHATLPEKDTAELLLSFAATLCAEHCLTCRESRLRVAISGSGDDLWEGVASTANLELLLDRFALAQPGSATGTTALLSQAIAHASASTRVVLVTSRIGGHGASANEPPATVGRAHIIHVTPESYRDFVIIDESEGKLPAEETSEDEVFANV